MTGDADLTAVKDGNIISTSLAGDGVGTKGHVSGKYIGTVADQQDMLALGKDQVLRVCFLVPNLWTAYKRLIF